MNEWYYEHNNAQEGPVSADSLRDLIRREVVARDTLIWQKGMGDWKPAADIAEFAGSFGGPPPIRTPVDIDDAPPVGAPSASRASGDDRWGDVPPKIDNHLAKAIIVTVLCCLPFGVVAIVNSSKVDPAVARGDYDEARRKSEEANKWANWSIIASAVVIGLYLLLMFIGGIGGAFSGGY